MTDAIKINGKKFMTSKPFDREISCWSEDTEPNAEGTRLLARNYRFEANLQTDIIFYDSFSKEVCTASIYNSTANKQKLPRVSSPEELKLDDFPSAKILYINEEGAERKINKLVIESTDPEVSKDVEKFLANFGVKESENLTYDVFKAVENGLKYLSIDKGKIIVARLEQDEDKKLVMTVRVKDITADNVKFVIRNDGALSKEGVDRAKEILAEQVKDSPKKMAALYFHAVSLEEILASNEEVRSFPCSLSFKKGLIDNTDKISYIVTAEKPATNVLVTYVPQYIDYLTTASEEEREAASIDLKEMQEKITSANNTSDLYVVLDGLKNRAASGWVEGKRSYLLSYSVAATETGEPAIFINRTPFPKKIELEGDFQDEDRTAIEEILRPAVVGGKVDLVRVDEAREKIKGLLIEKGYLIKNLGFVIDYEGGLHFILELRRWDSIYSIEVSSEAETEENKKKKEKLLSEIILPYSGKFIKREDLNGVQRKLGRGFSRSNVEPTAVTDPETGKTKMIFVATEVDSSLEAPVTGGGSSFGFMLSGKIKVPDNGRGTSYGGGLSANMTWDPFVKLYKSVRDLNFSQDWDIKDVYFLSLDLFLSTTISPDERIGVSVYGWSNEYNGASEQVAGSSVTYTHYYLNDSLVTGYGGAIELIRHGKKESGFTDLPVRVKPAGNVCYNGKNMNVCVNAAVSTIASNYGQTTATFSYKIPLSKDKEDAPYIKVKAAGGIQMGDVPELEQFNQMSSGLPFALSFTGGGMHFGKYMSGASVELVQIISSWFAIKPLVGSISQVGSYASATIGSCLSFGPFDFCVGYRQGLKGAKSGIDPAIGMSDTFDVPEQLRMFMEMLTMGRLR